jgi:putative tryptophan/tyrosine transport system substrate-binding protein
VRRRDFFALVGGMAAISWPFPACAQQGDRVRRIGVLMNLAAEDPVSIARARAFAQGLQGLGWIEGRNVRVDYRWAAGKADLFHQHAAEIAALAPDVILAAGTALPPVLQATRTIPVVFVHVTDPVGNNYVASLSRPGGNTTGFLSFEYSLAAKWVELLKQIAPNVKLAGVLRDVNVAHGIGQFAVIQSVAPSHGIDVIPINLGDANEIERGVAGLAQFANAGLILTASPTAPLHRDLIITLAARHRLPAVFIERLFATAGGLLSYGPDFADQYRRAASYIDRILKGEKPADLPVQAPTKYELVINLKTARALGLTAPPTLLARADEVIE